MSTIDNIIKAKRLLESYGAVPRELHLTSKNYDKLKAEVNEIATFVSLDQAEVAKLPMIAFQGLEIFIDDTLADDEAKLR